MKTLITVLVFSLLLIPSVDATFSIVAVDTATGDVGGAGASCIDNAQIITSLLENIGGVHTQAWWLKDNQKNARILMAAGIDPDSIISWLYINDDEGRPEKRQYGVVTLAGNGASAGFTGTSTDYYKGHITGPGYAIQGNILLGPEILTGMENAFLTTDGPLQDKLMAALEAAKVPGADTRCLANNKSSISAFIRVIKPGDGSTPFLYKAITNTTGSTEPLDLLKIEFDNWKVSQFTNADETVVDVSPSILLADGISTAAITITPKDASGNLPAYAPNSISVSVSQGTVSEAVDNLDGSYSSTLTAGTDSYIDDIQVEIQTEDVITTLNNATTVTYFVCGDVDFSGGFPIISDLTFIVDYLFAGGDAPPVQNAADTNADGEVGISDLTTLVNYLFASGNLSCGLK